MMRSSALISHVQQLARDVHAQASRYPTKKQDAQKPVDHSACIVRQCLSAIRLFVADVCKGWRCGPSCNHRQPPIRHSFLVARDSRPRSAVGRLPRPRQQNCD